MNGAPVIGTVLSQDGTYRYTLERKNLGDVKGETVLFIMLNPSTADAREDDPTIRRCIGFARAWGYTNLLVGNLFAYRATNPKELLAAEDPVGPLNDRYLELMSGWADLTICAWGAHKLAKDRAPKARLPKSLRALKVTKDGHPGHPLYLKSDLRPIEFEVPA